MLLSKLISCWYFNHIIMFDLSKILRDYISARLPWCFGKIYMYRFHDTRSDKNIPPDTTPIYSISSFGLPKLFAVTFWLRKATQTFQRYIDFQGSDWGDRLCTMNARRVPRIMKRCPRRGERFILCKQLCLRFYMQGGIQNNASAGAVLE